MAVGRPIRVPSAAGLAPGYSNILSAMMRGSEVETANIRAAGAALGGGIAAYGQNRREDKARSDARAEREQDRAESRAERDALRSERKAEREEARAESQSRWQAQFGLEQRAMALREQAEQRMREEGKAELAVKGAEAAAMRAREDAINSTLTGEQSDGRAVAEAQETGNVVQRILRRVGALPPAPTVLQQDEAGGARNLTDPQALYDEAVRKYQEAKAARGEAKNAGDWFVRNAEVAKRQKAVTELQAALGKRKQVEATQKRATAQNAARVAIESEARRLGVEPSMLIERFRGDLLSGNAPSPETIRAVAKGMEPDKPKEPKPTPQEEGVNRGTTNFTAAEHERALRRGLPAEERDLRAKAEYHRRVREDMEESEKDALLDAILSDWGL